MTTKARPPTLSLEQRVKQGMAQHRLWLDEHSFPETRLHSWCGASLLIDYLQFGMQEMNRRMMSFVAAHDGCGHDMCKIEASQEEA